MCAVRILELVNQSYIELECRAVDVILYTLIAIAIESVVQRRLNIYLPCLLLTEIECKVKTNLWSKVVHLAKFLTVVGEHVTPSETVNSWDLKRTWLALVSAKPVAEVGCTKKTCVHKVNESASCEAICSLEVDVALNCETPYRSKVTTKTNAEVGCKVLCPWSMIGCLGCKTSVYAKINIVKCLALLNSLCRNWHRQHCGSKKCC